MKVIFSFALFSMLSGLCISVSAQEVVWCPVGPNGIVKEACRPEKANCEIQDSNRYGCRPFPKK